MRIWHMTPCGDFSIRTRHGSIHRDVLCSSYPEHVTVTRDENKSLSFELKGRKPHFINYIRDWVVSAQVRFAIEKARLVGLAFRKADCWRSSRDGAEQLEYFEMRFMGWGGVVNPASGMRMEYHCAACGLTEFSPLRNPDKIFDSKLWDGSDVFHVYPVGRFVSERFKQFIETSRFSGVRFESPEEFLEPGLKDPPLTHRGVAGLRYYFPESTASQFVGASAVW